jgi:hypothetical protein
MSAKLNPTIRRHYLFALAGIFWTVAGGILCVRATIWLGLLSPNAAFGVAVTSLICAGAGYALGFSKIVVKNIVRINQMPDRANIFAFTALRGYVMIALMMTIGITLRNSSIPKYYLTIPYFAMGGILLIGSVQFYRKFISSILKERSQ